MDIGNDFQERVFAASEYFHNVVVAFDSPTKCTLTYGSKEPLSVEVKETDKETILTVTGPKSALGVYAPGRAVLPKPASSEQIVRTFKEIAVPSYKVRQSLLKQADVPSQFPKDMNGKRLYVGQPVRLLCAPQNEHVSRCMEKTGIVHSFSSDRQYAVLHFLDEPDLRMPVWKIIGLRRKKYGTRSH